MFSRFLRSSPFESFWFLRHEWARKWGVVVKRFLFNPSLAVFVTLKRKPLQRLDILRQVLVPAGIEPAQRRTTELTIATLPLRAVQGYLERGYVTARPVGKKGLTGEAFL